MITFTINLEGAEYVVRWVTSHDRSDTIAEVSGFNRRADAERFVREFLIEMIRQGSANASKENTSD